MSSTASDNEWQWVVQRVTTSDTTSQNEWYNEWQWEITSDKEWQPVVISANFPFLQIREELKQLSTLKRIP